MTEKMAATKNTMERQTCDISGGGGGGGGGEEEEEEEEEEDYTPQCGFPVV